MKKRIFTLTLTLMMCLILMPVTAFADDAVVVDEITIQFEQDGQSFEITFTNVANLIDIVTEAELNRPGCIYYYPDATVMVSVDLDNSDNFMGGFFLEADYHFGDDGKVKANTPYRIEDVYYKLAYILNGDEGNEGTGTLGLGPVFLARAELLGSYTQNHASIYDYQVKAVSQN